MSDIIEPNINIDTDTHVDSIPSSNSYRDMNFISLKGFFGVDSPEPAEEEAMNWMYEHQDKN